MTEQTCRIMSNSLVPGMIFFLNLFVENDNQNVDNGANPIITL